MQTIFVLSSITYAMKAQEVLKGNNLDSLLTRRAEIKSVKGCGYGLAVSQRDEAKAEALLAKANIKILGRVSVK